MMSPHPIDNSTKYSMANNLQTFTIVDDREKSSSSSSDDDVFQTDARIDIGDVQAVVYTGLNREQVTKYANDPYWIKLRWILFALFWLAWVIMLVGAIYIVVVTPKCLPPPPRNWWEKGPIYQVTVRSFQDGRLPHDGVGDLQGIKSRVDYIEDLGVTAVWLSPIFKSPMINLGYDITDFVSIDPIFGTLDDLKDLIHTLYEKGIHMVLDIVPNHSSDQHDWFQKSIKKEYPYTDYYVWVPENGTNPDGTPKVPNNWLSVYGGSAWEWNDQRQEFYFHQFAVEQPDLNYRNQHVVEEMKKVIKFWMGFGVDGFRLNSVAHLFEDASLGDEPLSNKLGVSPDQYESLNHIYTQNLPEVLDVIAEFRAVVDENSKNDTEPKLLMAETQLGIEETMKYYGNTTYPLSSFPLNFEMMHLQGEATAQNVYDNIHLWLDNTPEGAWPNWMLGNQENRRFASRHVPDLVDGMNMISLLLPGTLLTYNGEEIGMENTQLTYEQTVDPLGCKLGPERYNEISKDPQRTPMQWDGTKNAGFSEANSTWLPVNPNYPQINVKNQQKAPMSHLKVYQAVVKTRESLSFKYGSLEVKVLHGNVLALTRIKKGSPGYLVAVNFGNTPVRTDVSMFRYMPEQASVLTHSVQFSDKTAEIGGEMYTNDIPLGPKEAVTLAFAPDIPPR